MSFIVHPSKWEVEHAGAIFSGQAYQATHDGELPDTPMWRMLEFRHSLNSARFDHWHPNVGLMLERDAPVLHSVQLSPYEIQNRIGQIGVSQGPLQPFVPEHSTTAPPTSDVSAWRAIATAPPRLTSQSVPEPSGELQGLTALALTVAIMLKRHRLRRLASRGG